MKKIILILLLAVASVQTFSQRGDLSVGAKGGYVISASYYNSILYGIDLAYHISNPLEVAFTGLMNSNISYEDILNNKKSLAAYSASLDLRLYLLHQREWGTGPALGGQFYIVNNKTDNLGADKTLGFNIGWHARVNLTDNLKINGGWRYTNAKAKDKSIYWNDTATFDMSHHLLYFGIAYTFELR